MKILILLALILASCSDDDRIDLAHTITPHETKPMILHAPNSCDLLFDEVVFIWHEGKLGDEQRQGSTSELSDDPLVAHTLEDISRHLAWVEQNVRPTLSQVMVMMGFDPEMVRKSVPTIARHVLLIQNRMYGDIVRAYRKENPVDTMVVRNARRPARWKNPLRLFFGQFKILIWGVIGGGSIIFASVCTIYKKGRRPGRRKQSKGSRRALKTESRAQENARQADKKRRKNNKKIQEMDKKKREEVTEKVKSIFEP